MFLCAVLLMLAAPGAQPSTRTTHQRVERGYELAQHGDLKAAEAELREALKLSPDDALALAVLGMILSRQPKLEEANTYLERALKLDPRDTGTRYNLAVNLFRMGKPEPAKANLDVILKQKPDHKAAALLLDEVNAKAVYEAALEEYRQGRFAKSQALIEQTIANGNRDPKSLRLLAWSHHRQNRPNDAREAIRHAIQLAPEDPAAYSNAAQIFLEERDFKGADAAVTRALELAPGHVPSLKLKAMLAVEHGDLKQAMATFQRAVELDRSDPEALQGLGTAQQMLFQYEEAAVTFKKGMIRFPTYGPMYQAFGKLLLDPGARRGTAGEVRAAELLEKALALDPSLPAAHYELGRLLLNHDKTSDALRHLEAAEKLDPYNGPAHLALARAYGILARTADQSRQLALYRELEARNAQ
jgi:tetratricopeptide (TPR) repeat protein